MKRTTIIFNDRNGDKENSNKNHIASNNKNNDIEQQGHGNYFSNINNYSYKSDNIDETIMNHKSSIS